MIKITFLNSFLCEKGGGGLFLAPPPPRLPAEKKLRRLYEKITEVIWEVEVALVTECMFEEFLKTVNFFTQKAV